MKSDHSVPLLSSFLERISPKHSPLTTKNDVIVIRGRPTPAEEENERVSFVRRVGFFYGDTLLFSGMNA